MKIAVLENLLGMRQVLKSNKLVDMITQSKNVFKIQTFFFFFCLFAFSWAAPAAYRDSQARGPIGAVASALHHSHSNPRSEPRL